MTVKPESGKGIVFAAQGMAGPACAAALKKVRSLASAAPSGRAFAAIATLSEFSQAAESHLKAGNAALNHGDIPRAENEWTRAAAVIDQMASEARGGKAPRASARPEFLRRR
jgi:hypothetical protein